ncbi:hypothetical protein [Candidatus Ferrigenium straubiae]|jgi:outer membrane lipoprotein SlyB|uniref:hypothetical protein n=1 Tax=Candidatus Ferrigenium straubiae TaxID=2919506 RepID=UPI003F4AD7FC
MRILPLLIALLLAGCASDRQGGVGSNGDANNVATIKRGVVESVTPIELDASSGGGTSLGGLFGQVGGSNTGGGRGAVVGTILGGVLGSTLGNQSGIATKSGLEIWVKLDGEEGKSTYVMQPGKPDEFKVGERVRVLRKRGEARVEHETAAETPKEPAKDTPKEPPKP